MRHRSAGVDAHRDGAALPLVIKLELRIYLELTPQKSPLTTCHLPLKNDAQLPQGIDLTLHDV